MAKTYGTYKDSGIAWIGEIPGEWEVVRIKNKYSFQTGATPPTGNENYFDGDNIWVSIADMKEKVIADSKKKISNKGIEVCSMSIVPKGSLLYSFKLSVGNVAFAGDNLYTNEAIASFSPNTGYLPFLYYTAQLFIVFNSNTNIYGANILNQELIKNAFVPYPPLSVQQSISSFLDTKCGEIDSLISIQEEMISELLAYKQSVITEAVTKGLDKKAKMKNSGVEWIGDIPEEWEVCKLKRAYTLLNGRAYSDIELLENGKYRILRVGNLFTSDNWYYSDLELENDKYCENGDLLYGWSASIGPYLWKQEKVIYHYHIWKVLFKPNDLKFSYYLLDAITQVKQKDMHGSAMQHLTKSNMDNSYIPLPPLPVQQAIATYLDEKTSQIDSLIALKQSKIESLKEYKKSIIYEYVTGKKRV